MLETSCFREKGVTDHLQSPVRSVLWWMMQLILTIHNRRKMELHDRIHKIMWTLISQFAQNLIMKGGHVLYNHSHTSNLSCLSKFQFQFPDIYILPKSCFICIILILFLSLFVHLSITFSGESSKSLMVDATHAQI